MIIKATRLQAWTPAGGWGKSKPSHPPPPPLETKNKFFGYIGGLFDTFFFIWGPFCYVLLIFGGLFIMWGPFCYFLLHCGGLFATFYFMMGAFLLLFTSWWGPFFWACPPPPIRKFLRPPMIARIRGFESMLPEFFLCDRNLVGTGHVLLRFCLKNDENSSKL